MTQKLTIKDGTGSIQYLAVESSSYGFIPLHQISSSDSYPIYITASLSNPIPVTGNISVDVMVGDLITVTSSQENPIWVTGSTVVDVVIGDVINVTASSANPVYITGTIYSDPTPVTTVQQDYSSSFNWTTVASGSFKIANSDTKRKNLTVFNPGPSNLYIALSTNGGLTNGFILNNTSSAPTYYSFIVYPSGTYVSDLNTVNVFHGGYFISGAASDAVFITSVR